MGRLLETAGEPIAPVSGNGRKRFTGARVPDLESRRREALRRGRNPIRRFWVLVQRIAPLLIIAAVGVLLYLNATLLNAALLALNFVWQLAFGILITLFQFIAIFWFMSRSRVERIRPEDPKVITFDDYWGQANLKSLVRQWLGLLSDREAFVRMGGRYINGLLLYGEPGTGKRCLPRRWPARPGLPSFQWKARAFAICSGAWTP